MQYKNKSTGETVSAYEISEVNSHAANYSIYLREHNMTHGLFPEQTENYTPVKGDIYIDAGNIKDSVIMTADDFKNLYELAE